jgi:hypothetical protein
MDKDAVIKIPDGYKAVVKNNLIHFELNIPSNWDETLPELDKWSWVLDNLHFIDEKHRDKFYAFYRLMTMYHFYYKTEPYTEDYKKLEVDAPSYVLVNGVIMKDTQVTGPCPITFHTYSMALKFMRDCWKDYTKCRGIYIH